MKFIQRIKQNISKERQTLKTLTFRQKIRYIRDYYKGRFFILFCLCLIGFYGADMWMTMQRETVLEGFFTNDGQDLFPAKEIEKEFSRRLGLSSKQQVIFDDSLFVQIGSGIEYHTSSQSKIVAYISARELDFLVTTEELTRYYTPNFPIYDLEELLPEELLTRLKDQLYYGLDGTGQEKACAVSMEGSRFAKRAASTDDPPYYLMVFSYTEHADAMIEFLKYAFEIQ